VLNDELIGPIFTMPKSLDPDYTAMDNLIHNLPSQAQTMYENIVERIQKFEENMPNDMQAGGKLVSGPGTIFLINKVGYMDPDIILFSGLLPDSGATVELVQHISQLNLLLTALPRRDDTSKPRREIGFQPPKLPDQP
jgi:hypothetical protein